MLTDAVGGLSTLMADWMLVREGQRIAAELALLEQRLLVRSHTKARACQPGADGVKSRELVPHQAKGNLLTNTSTNTSTASLSFGGPKSPR